jgi:hypothetical protein
MIARTVVAIASLAVAAGSTGGCLAFYEIPIEVPIQSKIDVSSFSRILVAGFLSGGSDAIDSNTETARLLRSQLRNRQDLRVIDADALSLVEEARRRAGADAAGSADPVPVGPSTGDAPQVTEQDLARYEAIFNDAEFWKSVGATYEQPLIVTGSVLFTEVARSGISAKPVATIDQNTGVEQYRTEPVFRDQKGYAISPKFIFIDGRTGAQLHTEAFHEEVYYPAGETTPALSSYFELMDRLLPGFLGTLSSQTIRGSRILLK